MVKLLSLLALLMALSKLSFGVENERARINKLSNLTGEEAFDEAESAWDRTYARKDFVFGKEPVPFLKRNLSRLPRGRVLDIAMGEGRNSIFLAKHGFVVEGVDISAVGLRKAQKLAAANKVKIQTINADLNKYQIKPNTYEVILNMYYLNRGLFPQIKAGLKKGGILVFENNSLAQAKYGKPHTWAREPLVGPGEMKELFKDFDILEYHETDDGKEALVSMIARKRD